MKTNLTPLAYFSCLSFNRNHLFLQFCKRQFRQFWLLECLLPIFAANFQHEFVTL